MAESLVQVTEGSGKKLHTWNRTIGANSVEDEYVLLGENALPTYTIAPGIDISTATANSHLLQIMAGASLKVRIRRIEIYQTVAATTAALLPIALYRLSTAGTGGTALTAFPMDPTEAGASCAPMILPTVKGTEANGMVQAAMYMMQTVAASAQLTQPGLVFDFDRLRAKPLVISAGATNGIAVKNLAACAGASVRITVVLDETSFS